MTGSRLGLLVLLALPFGFRAGTAAHHEEDPAPTAPAASSPAGLSDSATAAFKSTVRPIVAAKCSPCHEPGGKMYDRLPFDRGETIASHGEGVLKRLKGDDRAAVEKWLATLRLPPAPAK